MIDNRVGTLSIHVGAYLGGDFSVIDSHRRAPLCTLIKIFSWSIRIIMSYHVILFDNSNFVKISASHQIV